MYLNEKNVESRPIWKPIYLFKHYKKNPKMNLDETTYIYERALSLPSSVFLAKKLR